MAVPKLRFKANDGSEFPEWEEKTIGEIATKVDRKANEGSTAPVMMISQGNGFIFQSEKYSRENSGQSLKKYTLLQNGEMAYNHGASKACPYGITYPLVEVAEARVPFVYHCFSLASKENQGFWKLALNSSNVNRQLKKMVSSSVRDDGLLNISFDTYMDVKVWHPSIPEQNKIADCMFILDTVIANCQSEADAWEKYKRGVMQQLFSQQVRFKADNGSEYPDWGEKSLGTFCDIVTKQTGFDYTATIKPSLLRKPERNALPYLQTKNFSGVEFDYNTDYFIPEKIANNFPKIILDRKCVLFSIVGASVGNVALFPATTKCFLSGAICVAKTIFEDDATYIYYFMTSQEGQRQIFNMTKGGAQATITIEDIRNITINIPRAKEEQHKIADCLSAFDEVIDKAKQKLEAYKQLKKGLLQQMFV